MNPRYYTALQQLILPRAALNSEQAINASNMDHPIISNGSLCVGMRRNESYIGRDGLSINREKGDRHAGNMPQDRQTATDRSCTPQHSTHQQIYQQQQQQQHERKFALTEKKEREGERKKEKEIVRGAHQEVCCATPTTAAAAAAAAAAIKRSTRQHNSQLSVIVHPFSFHPATDSSP
ncbi:hypothetical protein ACH3XW_33925 [Acanthocheilonema viteae]